MLASAFIRVLSLDCHLRESCLIASIISAFFALFGFLFFAYEILNFRRDAMRLWSMRKWKSAHCTVLESGVSYKGDCSKWSATPTVHNVITGIPKAMKADAASPPSRTPRIGPV